MNHQQNPLKDTSGANMAELEVATLPGKKTETWEDLALLGVFCWGGFLLLYVILLLLGAFLWRLSIV